MSIPAFDGFRRSDGSVGVRNHMLVMSVTGLTGPTARRIGRAIPGARVVTTPFGSGLIGEDAELQKRALTAFGRHPNVGAALVIGGTPPFVESIAQAIAASGKPTEALVLDDCDHDAVTLTERGTRIAARMMRDIPRARRARIKLRELCLGMECGRSEPELGARFKSARRLRRGCRGGGGWSRGLRRDD